MMVASQANPVAKLPRADDGTAKADTASAALGVVLVGGDPLYREGVKSLMNRHQLLVLGEFDSMHRLSVAEARELQPRVVLVVSPDFAAASGEAWRQRYRDLWPTASVLVMAQPGDESLLVDCLKAGVEGCLFTDMSAEALIQSIRLVSLGEGLFPTRIGKLLSREGHVYSRPRLTPREKDILRGLLAGHSNKMIANDLGTTDMTVKAQLRHLLRKLGVANRTQAALWAREQGIASELQN